MAALAASKLKVVAAFIEARGSVSEAAEIAGVSKQYVYEVLGRLRSLGYKFRGFPSLGALGRVLLALSRGGALPDGEFSVARLKVYSFGGEELLAGIYVLPAGVCAAELLRDLSDAETAELVDVLPAAPLYDLTELRPREGAKLLRPPRRELDDVDKAIVAKLFEDLSFPITASVPGVSKSLLSYHYRRHVRPLLRVLLDTHPMFMHARPLLLAEIRADEEGWVAALLRAQQVYLLMPRLDSLSAYALLDVEDPYALLKKLAEARRERGLGLKVALIGYVDPEKSEKLRIPCALLS